MPSVSPRRIMIAASVFLLVTGFAPGTAQADPPHRTKHHKRHHDVRHGHDRHYLPHGHRAHSVPRGHLRIRHGGHPYYYHSGVWYRPHAGYFVVGRAPIGAVVRWLPHHHTTVWVGGLPYYYANLTYYAWDHRHRGYVVVQQPEAVDEAATRASELFIYPNRGQSEQKQADDRYECHAWAVKQTDYDPSLPLREEQRANAEQLRSDYFRAMSACLEGRGYTVK